MQLTDSDYNMKTPSAREATVSTTCFKNHQQMLLSDFNELKAKEYLTFQESCEQIQNSTLDPAVQQHLE